MMVTARALGELKNLGIETSYCLEMPELVEVEARALFLNQAKPKIVVDERIIMECVNRCYFGKGDGKGSKHYHPLALKVLGSQLVGRHPLEWTAQLKEEDVFNRLQEDENLVFSVLRRSFDSLKDEYKMLFMDVALFDDGGHVRNMKRRYTMYGSGYDSRFIKDGMLNWYTIFAWLSIIHGLSVDEVKKRLNELKKRSLLEELGDGTGQIGMHDLWREFAVMETKRVEEESLQWVHEHDSLGNERSVESCMAGGGWKKLRRICIEEGKVKCLNFSRCLKVTVLRLMNVDVDNGALDLSPLKSIKSLEIVHPYNYYHEEMKQHKVSGIGQLLNLAVLTWLDIDGESLSAVEEISYLTNLRVLHLRLDPRSGYESSSMSLDLQQLRYLQDVRVEISGMVSISGFSSRMKGLQILDLSGCRKLRSCEGVGDADGLEVLLLRWCYMLEELPNLQKLTRLRLMDIWGCGLLKALPGLGSLIALRWLYGSRACLAMKELPGMSNLAKLEVLDLQHCCELKRIPGAGDLVALRELGVCYHWLHDLPDLGNLTNLQRVEISGRYVRNAHSERGCGMPGRVLNLAVLESVSRLAISHVNHELANLRKLTALKSLKLERCNFERLPHMGGNMRLESLSIWDCPRQRVWDGVRGLGRGPHSQVDLSCGWTLPYLQEIVVQQCESLDLPDLSHFPQLRTLSLKSYWGSSDSRSAELAVHCHAIHVHLETLEITESAIRELPDLRHFPSLQTVCIHRCNNLTNLAIREPLSALSRVVIRECRNLRTVPNINLLPRLSQFSFCYNGVQLNKHEVQKLIAQGFRDNGFGTYMPDPSRIVVLPAASELNCHADEQVAVNDLAAGPSSSEPCTGEFIPFDDSLSKLGISSVPERALELGSSGGGGDQEQTKKLKNIE